MNPGIILWKEESLFANPFFQVLRTQNFLLSLEQYLQIELHSAFVETLIKVPDQISLKSCVSGKVAGKVTMGIQLHSSAKRGPMALRWEKCTRHVLLSHDNIHGFIFLQVATGMVIHKGVRMKIKRTWRTKIPGSQKFHEHRNL